MPQARVANIQMYAERRCEHIGDVGQGQKLMVGVEGKFWFVVQWNAVAQYWPLLQYMAYQDFNGTPVLELGKTYARLSNVVYTALKVIVDHGHMERWPAPITLVRVVSLLDAWAISPQWSHTLLIEATKGPTPCYGVGANLKVIFVTACKRDDLEVAVVGFKKGLEANVDFKSGISDDLPHKIPLKYLSALHKAMESRMARARRIQVFVKAVSGAQDKM